MTKEKICDRLDFREFIYHQVSGIFSNSLVLVDLFQNLRDSELIQSGLDGSCENHTLC